MWTKAVGRFIGRNGQRIAVTVAGFAVLLAGVALLVLPGPGWLLIFVGLGILSTEYMWARRLLDTAKQKAEQAKNAVIERKNGRAERREARRNGALPTPTTTRADPRSGMAPGRILIGHLGVGPTSTVKEGQVPAGGQEREGAPRVLCVALPARGGRLDLLFPAEEKNSVLWIGARRQTSRSTSRPTLLTNHPTRTESLYKDLAPSFPRRRSSSVASTATSCPTRSSTRCGNASVTL